MTSPLSSGRALHELAARLYPLRRSIAGRAVRETLAALAERAPIATLEIASGTPVFDWVTPREWELHESYFVAPDGRRLADAAVHNLHALNFGAAYRGRVARAELERHLHSLPDRPDAIPYRTSYWREEWGFCLPHRLRQSLPEGEYEVVIDAVHRDGAMSWGECALAGESRDEVLFSTHLCHPQLANDNLSGLVVMTALAAELAARPRRRLSYRFLFLPGTIGAIAWLATHPGERARIRHGLVAAGLGDGGRFHYKKTRRGDAPVDALVPRVLAALGEEAVVEEFVPFGYDERQYNSPGIALPVGSLTRTPWGRYPEYHTSMDDLDFVRPEHLERSLEVYRAVVDALERRVVYRSRNPQGEPMLGKRGLYRDLGGGDEGRERELALLWVLNLSDGEHDLETIAERSRMPLEKIRAAADALLAVDLLETA